MSLKTEDLKNTLKAELKTIFTEAAASGYTVDQVATKMAEKISAAVETYVKSGSVSVTVPSHSVSTTGTAAAQAGTIAAISITNGTIS